MKRIKEEMDQSSGFAALVVLLGASLTGAAIGGGVLYGLFKASEAVGRVLGIALGV